MGNEVFGPYESTEEVIKTVTTLELKGYKSSNISLFANEDHAEELIKNTDVNVESENGNAANQPPILEKFQKLFTNGTDGHANLHEKLTDRNISDWQAEKFTEAIENGEIVVVADNELRMGNDSAADVISLKVDMIQRN